MCYSTRESFEIRALDSLTDSPLTNTLHCIHHSLPYKPWQVVMATNRIDSLDPALIRPGRIDRKIEFPLPDEKTKRRVRLSIWCKLSGNISGLTVQIFQIHTARMTLADDVNLEEFIGAKDELSGADIKASASKYWVSGHNCPLMSIHLKLGHISQDVLSL